MPDAAMPSRLEGRLFRLGLLDGRSGVCQLVCIAAFLQLEICIRHVPQRPGARVCLCRRTSTQSQSIRDCGHHPLVAKCYFCCASPYTIKIDRAISACAHATADSKTTDSMVNLLFCLFRLLLPTFVFASIGWLSLKLLTFGRYPKFPWGLRNMDDLDALSFLGAAETILLLCAIAWFHRPV